MKYLALIPLFLLACSQSPVEPDTTAKSDSMKVVSVPSWPDGSIDGLWKDELERGALGSRPMHIYRPYIEGTKWGFYHEPNPGWNWIEWMDATVKVNGMEVWIEVEDPYDQGFRDYYLRFHGVRNGNVIHGYSLQGSPKDWGSLIESRFVKQ